MRLSLLRPFSLLLIALATFQGCDVIDDPIIPLTIGYRGEAEPPSFDPLTDGPQHVLLEDFTAHQCGNCPPAGALAAQLAEDNAGRVHPLAIHAGSLAAVSDAPSTPTGPTPKATSSGTSWRSRSTPSVG